VDDEAAWTVTKEADEKRRHEEIEIQQRAKEEEEKLLAQEKAERKEKVERKGEAGMSLKMRGAEMEMMPEETKEAKMMSRAKLMTKRDPLNEKGLSKDRVSIKNETTTGEYLQKKQNSKASPLGTPNLGKFREEVGSSVNDRSSPESLAARKAKRKEDADKRFKDGLKSGLAGPTKR